MAGEISNADIEKWAAEYNQAKKDGTTSRTLVEVANNVQKEPVATTTTTAKKTTPQKTAQDMQKKKEDAIDEQTPVDSEQIKNERIKKEYAEVKEKLDEEKKNVMKEQAKGRLAQNQATVMADLTAEQRRLATRELQLRAANDAILQEEREAADAAVTAQNLQTLSQLSEAEKKKLDEYINKKLYLKSGGYVKAEMPEELVRKYGAERASELAETYWREKNAETAKKYEEAGAAHADKHPLLSNVATVPINIVAGITGATGHAADAELRTGQYQTLDPNAAGTEYQKYSAAIRDQTVQNIEGEDPNGWRKAASIAYQGGMALADSTAQAATLGGAGAALVAGSNTFSQTLSDASAAGATPEQAVAMATSAAAIEALSEKIPMDNLADAFKGSKKSGMELLKQVTINAGIEMTTEELSFAGTFFAELAILKEKSSYKQDITKGILQGLSPAEAVAQANKNVEQEALNTALVSFISGGGGHIVANVFARGGDNRGTVTEAKPGEVAQTREDLAKRYGENQDVQAVEQETERQAKVEADKENAPQVIQNAIKNQHQDDLHSDTVAAYRAADIIAIQNNPEAMQWLKDRGYNGDMKKMLDSVDAGAYDIQSTSQATPETNTPSEPHVQEEQPAQQQASPEQNQQPTQQEVPKQAPQQAQQPQQEQSSSPAANIVADLVRKAQNGGTVSNKDAAQILSDPAAVAELQKQSGTEITGTNSEKRTTVKDIVKQLVEQQNGRAVQQESMQQPQTETQQPAQAVEVPQTQPQEQPQNVQQEVPQVRAQETDTGTEVQMDASNVSGQSPEGGQQMERETAPPELQRERINSVRDQAIPVTDPDGRVVSEAAGNIYTSSRTPDSFAPTIQRLVNEGRVSHDVQTNEESLQKAAQSIAEDGSIQKALESIKEVAQSGRTGALDVAKGVLIYDELVNSNDSTHQALAEECFVTLSQLATNTGRPMQLFSLFRKMSPESQVKVLQNELDRNIQKMQKAGTVKKDYKSSVDPKLLGQYREAAEEYQKAQGDKAKREAEQKMNDIQNVIYLEEAAKMPTTFKAKWDAWRYTAMLGNVKTQLRNIAGNTLMMPYTEAKRTVGAILEKGVSKDKRTKAVFQDRALLNWARQDAKESAVKSVLDGSAKTGDDRKTVLSENIKTFGDRWAGERLNDMQSLINKAASGGDLLFKNNEYARSLAGFLKARGYSAADVQAEGGVPVDVMNEARNYAVNEALKATFNDSNKLSDFLANDLRYKGDNPIGKAVNMLGEGIMPFRKTPANVVMRFKDYSPAGLAQGVWNLAANVRNGKVSAATAIDQIAAGMTGTAAMVLGHALAGGLMGVKLTGSGTDEDEQRQGHQNYSLEFSINGQEYSYTIDWASPANLPLFVGANLREMQESQDTASFLTAVVNAGRGAFEPLLQLSCLSSLNDMFESARYADEGEGLYAFFARGATNYLTQGIPSLARQATQAANEHKKTTFVTSDDPLIQDTQKTIAGLGVGNPYKTDKVNAWGEKEKQGEATAELLNVSEKAGRGIDAFFNPGTLKKIDNSDLEKEITRLNQAQDENVSPSYIPKTISYTDKDGNLHKDYRLTEEEYQKMAEVQGQTAREILDKMIESPSYKGMDDGMKAKAMQMAYSYAREKAKGEVLGTTYSDSWMMGMIKGTEANKIIMKVSQNELNSALSNIKTARANNYSKENQTKYVQDLEKAYTAYSKMDSSKKLVVMESATGDTKKYLEVRQKGVTTQQYLDATKAISNLKPETDYAEVRDIQIREAIGDLPGMSDTAKDTLMKAYMTDYDPSAKSPQTTELKYDYARQELGLSPSEYSDVYRVQLDGGKKAEKIAEWQSMGYTKEEANMFYRLFAATGKTKIDVVKWYNE